MEDIIKSEITQIVSSFTQLPYLFVGTGISIRYSTAPSWDNLLKEIWIELSGQTELEYKFLVRKVEHETGFDTIDLEPDEKKYKLNPSIASYIKNQFNNQFFADRTFVEKVFNEDEIKKVIENEYDPFKFYISKKVELKINDDKLTIDETKCLKNMQNKIAGIITTNYDSILEQIFPDFDVLMGNESLLIANTDNLFNIYKIHGSYKEPNTIIITQEDYSYFTGKLKYLSAKLLTLFVEHPIIFIGYSISDVNIRSILEEITLCLSNDQLSSLKNKFIFIKPAFEEKNSINTREIIFNNKKLIMNEITLNNYLDFYEELSKINSSMPVRVIRKMQDMFCKFIATTEATNNIFVGNLSNPDISDDKVGIYFGPLETVSNIGFKTYSLNDIMEDILFDNKPYLINKSIINETFKIIRSTSGQTYLPIYKYLSKLDLTIDYLPENFKIIKSEAGIELNRTEKDYCKNKPEFSSIKGILSNFPKHHAKQLANIQKNFNNIPLEELSEFLKDKFYDGEFRKKMESQYRKLVALYDYKKYSK